MALRNICHPSSGMAASTTSSPATLASAFTPSACAGWLRRSASPFASRGTATASHWVASVRIARTS
eukprot:201708-Pleurochrysis_carterae.AAC.1